MPSFENRHRTPSEPAIDVFDIMPDDSQDLARDTIALNVTTPGRVRVTTVGGTTTDVEIHPGHAFPLRARRVWLTGTTATGLRGLA